MPGPLADGSQAAAGFGGPHRTLAPAPGPPANLLPPPPARAACCATCRRQPTYIDYCAFTGTVGGTATFNPTVDIGQSFKTGAAGPFTLTAVKLKLYNSAGCTSGCTLRLQLWSASSTNGQPTSLLYTQNLSPTLTGEAAGGCLGGAHCLAGPTG